MFVTFHSRAAGDFSMFEEVAVSLLKKMGHSGTVPSAIMPEDIPQALQQLRVALGAEPAEVSGVEGDELLVSLSRRAYPLIKMLEASVAQKSEVMWD
ncbi:MAG: DUF1840 domain-containing protein [Pseudomonadota bacterium]